MDVDPFASTRDTPLPLHPVVAKVRRLEAELNEYLILRADEIRGALLALASRQHVFYLGTPGTAKSLLVSEVARRIRGDGDTFFLLEFNAFILREEIFGPISLRAMRDHDSLARKYHGFLPAATIAQLDEIWKAPPSLLNTLLRLFNEREFRNDDRVVRSPLISAFVTSNELPPSDRSLDALYDRIMLRYEVRPLSDVAARQRASTLRLAVRAFENQADVIVNTLARDRVRAWSEIEHEIEGEIRAGTLSRSVAEERLANRRIQIAAELLPADLHQPGHWLIDQFGELYSDRKMRDEVGAGEFFPPLPPALDREDVRALIIRAAKWATKHDFLAFHRTFLERSELDTLHGLVLAVEFPAEVEAAFYRIVDSLAGLTSVRRETELRTIIAASAVLAGRAAAAVEDLEVMKHALWNERKDIPEVARRVDAETINLREEVESLLATLDAWTHENEHEINLDYEAYRHRQGQRNHELSRFERLAEAYPTDPRVASARARAHELIADYERAVLGINPDPAGSARLAG